MATTSSRTETIELEPRPTASRTPAPATNEETSSILLASQAADSTVPDGGYGWIVLFGCSVITWWFVGTSYSWGVIQAALVEQGLATPSKLSFVGSLTPTFIPVLALINARIIRRIGARNTGVIAMALLGLGGVLAGFATRNIKYLFLTAGVLGGIGTSMGFMVVSVTPAQYFNKKRGLANGIVYAAGGLGGTAICFVMDGLIQRVGVPWTFRIIGLMTLATGVPGAWVVKERAPIKTSAFIDKYTLLVTLATTFLIGLRRLLRDYRFIILFLAGAVATFPLFVPPFFLPLYSKSLGLSSSTGAGLVAGFNFASAIGRLGCGLMSDRIGPLNTLLISLLASAGSMLVMWPVSSTIGPLAAFTVINGIANGGFFSTMPTVVGSVFGSARVSVAMGMVVSGWAGGYLMGAPIAGYLLAAYGGENSSLSAYHPAIFWAGSMALAAAGLVMALRLKLSINVFAKY